MIQSSDTNKAIQYGVLAAGIIYAESQISSQIPNKCLALAIGTVDGRFGIHPMFDSCYKVEALKYAAKAGNYLGVSSALVLSANVNSAVRYTAWAAAALATVSAVNALCKEAPSEAAKS